MGARLTARLTLLLIGSLSLAGCNFSPEPEIFEPDYQPEAVVFGLVSPDPGLTFVIVERTVTLEEHNRMVYAEQRIPTVVEDARVYVIGGGDSVRLDFRRSGGPSYPFYRPYRGKGRYVDRTGRLRVQSGDAYRLRVELASGQVITGSTLVPSVPTVLWPTEGLSVSFDEARSARVEWAKSSGAAAYIVSLLIDSYYRLGDRWIYAGQEELLRGYLTLEPWVELGDALSNYGFPSEIDSVGVQLEVTAIDPNYYDYIRSNSALAEVSGMGLELLDGGRGVFGSVARSVVHFTLTH